MYINWKGSWGRGVARGYKEEAYTSIIFGMYVNL
jgi:hypothetical protein